MDHQRLLRDKVGLDIDLRWNESVGKSIGGVGYKFEVATYQLSKVLDLNLQRWSWSQTEGLCLKSKGMIWRFMLELIHSKEV